MKKFRKFLSTTSAMAVVLQMKDWHARLAEKAEKGRV